MVERLDRIQVEQAVGRLDLDPVGQRHRRHDGTHERHQHLGVVIGLDRQQLPCCGVQHLGDDADVDTGHGAHPEPLQLVVVELVGVVDRRELGGVNEEQGAPQCIGAVSVGNPGQANQQSAGMLTDGLDDVVALRPTASAGPAAQRLTRCEPQVRIVGADVDDDFTGDAVRLGDPPDNEVHRLLVGVHHVDADATATDACDQGAQGSGGATAAADDLAEVLGVNVHLDSASAAVGHHVDANVVGVVDYPAHQVLDGVDDDSAHSATASAGAASAVSAGASAVPAGASAAASSAFLAGAFFFLAVVASPDGALSAAASAALNRSSLLVLGSATLSVPSVPGRPLNFCQSPVIFSRASTASVGWAPTPSQYSARSELISMTLGSSFGWFRPRTSMERPSRRLRASATAMRYWGLRILPKRASLILTAMVLRFLL